MRVFLFAILMLPAAVAAYAASGHPEGQKDWECQNCHQMDPPTHGNDRVAASRVPSDMPLGERNDLVCLTCHDCRNGSCILRRKSEHLCKVCHDCSKGMACLIQSAHIGGKKEIEARARDCLICHDGSAAKQATAKLGFTSNRGRSGSVKTDHPVEVLQIPKQGYNAVSDPRVVLVNGKVTCISCHDPYKNTKQRLVMSNSGSALCLTCHRK